MEGSSGWALYKVLFWHFLGDTQENVKTSIRIASLHAKI
jgi:hypothetical protein